MKVLVHVMHFIFKQLADGAGEWTFEHPDAGGGGTPK